VSAYVLPRLAVLLAACACLVAIAAPVATAQDEPPPAPSADLGVTKSGPEETTADADVRYSLSIQNFGPEPSSGATLTDALPAGMTFVSVTQDSGPSFTCTAPDVGEEGTVTCSIASLAVGATAEFTLVGHTPPDTEPGTIFTNIATASAATGDPDDENQTASASAVVPGDQADMSTAIQAPESSLPGANVTYTIEVANGGPDAGDATWEDTLPGTATFVSLEQESGPGFSCRTPAVGAGGTVTCAIRSFEAQARATFTLVVNIPDDTPSGSVFANTVSISTSANDPNSEGDSSTASTTISSADVAATKSGPATATAGETVKYTLTVRNDGPDAANSVTLVDELPQYLTFVSFTRKSGVVFTTAVPSAGSGGTVQASREVLASGESATFELVVRIDREAPSGTITNTAVVDAFDADPDTADNTASVDTAVTALPPDPPTGLSVSPASPANDNAPRVKGTAEAGSTVRVYTTADCSGDPAATGTAEAFASPGLTVSVPDESSTTFRATATDSAGTSSCSTSSVTYVEDSPPAAPTGLTVSPASPANDNSPRVSGTAQAGSTVRVYTTSDCSGYPAATGSAADFASPGLTVRVPDDSTTTFRATATDGGGTSPCSASSATYEEDSPPAAPSGLSVSPASPANDNSPRVSGTAQTGSTVRVYTTSDCSGDPAATGTAADFASPGLTVSVPDDSTTTFRATASDGGGTSPCSTSSATYEEDSPPAAPTGLSVSPSSPADDNEPRVSGTAQAGSTVHVFTTSDCSGEPAATGSAEDFASPGLTVTVADDSTTTFHATSTDRGGTSACSTSSATYEEDSPPAAPTGLSVSPRSPANDNAPRVTGAAQPGSTVRVYTTPDCSGEPAATGTAADFASPGLTVAVRDDSTTTFRATATDGAGTSSCSSSSARYEEDSPPPAPTALGVTPGSGSDENAPRIRGIAQPGSTVRVYATGDCTGAPAATGSAEDFGSPGLTVEVPNDSTTTFRATATDGGGTSPCSPGSVTYEERTPRTNPREEEPNPPLAPPAPWLLQRRGAPSATLSARGGIRVDTGYVAVCPARGPACLGRISLKTVLRSSTGEPLPIFLHRKAPLRTIAAGAERRIVFRLNRPGRRLLLERGALTAVLRGSIRRGGGAPVVRRARLRIGEPAPADR
jgi:uncharacterized repeat protein (TIGR01451 family)